MRLSLLFQGPREVRTEDERRDAARSLYHLGFLKNTREATIDSQWMPFVPDIARNKQVAAENAAAQVVDRMVLGLGSGSTADAETPVAPCTASAYSWRSVKVEDLNMLFIWRALWEPVRI
jgi:hypothetical protein